MWSEPAREEPATRPVSHENQDAPSDVAAKGENLSMLELSADRWAAIGAWTAGATGLAAGTWIAFDAKGDYDAAHGTCDGDACDDGAYEKIESARRRGWTATGVGALGILVAGGGVLLWHFEPFAHENPRARAEAVGVRVSARGASVWGQV